MRPFAIFVLLLGLICCSFAADTKPSAPAAASTESSAAAKTFDAVFAKAIDQARAEGQLSWGQAFRLKVAARNPSRVAEIKQAIADSAVDEGKYKSAASIMAPGFDWNSLLAFIKELLPLILQIISIFS